MKQNHTPETPNPAAWSALATKYKAASKLSYQDIADRLKMPKATVANAIMGLCRPTDGLPEMLVRVFKLEGEARDEFLRLAGTARIASNVHARAGAKAQMRAVEPLLTSAEAATDNLETILASFRGFVDRLEVGKPALPETLSLGRQLLDLGDDNANALRGALRELHSLLPS